MNDLVDESINLENKLIKLGVSKEWLLIKKEECLRDYLPLNLHCDELAIEMFYTIYLMDLNVVEGERLDYLTNTGIKHVNQHKHKRFIKNLIN